MKLYGLFYECINIPYQKRGAASYAIRREGESLYIFFESSKERGDWFANLDFAAVPYRKEGSAVWFAHRGFVRQWLSVKPVIEKRIVDKTVKRVIITGYSHGAALALLCFDYVKGVRPELQNSTEGYGFGCPRVFWGERDAGMDRQFEKFTVIRNIDDLVTHVPPSRMGYFHVGRLLEIGVPGRYSGTDAHKAENILLEIKDYESGL